MRLVAREKVDRMNGGAVRWTLGMRFSVFDFGYGHGICLLHSTNATSRVRDHKYKLPCSIIPGHAEKGLTACEISEYEKILLCCRAPLIKKRQIAA